MPDGNGSSSYACPCSLSDYNDMSTGYSDPLVLVIQAVKLAMVLLKQNASLVSKAIVPTATLVSNVIQHVILALEQVLINVLHVLGVVFCVQTILVKPIVESAQS